MIETSAMKELTHVNSLLDAFKIHHSGVFIADVEHIRRIYVMFL